MAAVLALAALAPGGCGDGAGETLPGRSRPLLEHDWPDPGALALGSAAFTAARSGASALRGLQRRAGVHRDRSSSRPAGAPHCRAADRPAPRARWRGRRVGPSHPTPHDAGSRGREQPAFASLRGAGNVAECLGDPRRHAHLPRCTPGRLAGGIRVARGTRAESRSRRRDHPRVQDGPGLRHADGRDRRGRFSSQGRAGAAARRIPPGASGPGTDGVAGRGARPRVPKPGGRPRGARSRRARAPRRSGGGRWSRRPGAGREAAAW